MVKYSGSKYHSLASKTVILGTDFFVKYLYLYRLKVVPLLHTFIPYFISLPGRLKTSHNKRIVSGYKEALKNIFSEMYIGPVKQQLSA